MPSSETANGVFSAGLAALSDRAGFSERHLTRLFARELGTTPARYVDHWATEPKAP